MFKCPKFFLCLQKKEEKSSPIVITGEATPINMAYKKKAPSYVKCDAIRQMNRPSGQDNRRQTRRQIVHEEKEEQEKEEMRCEVRKTGHIDCDFSFAYVDTQVIHEGLQPDMDDKAQNIIDHRTCSVASQVCIPQESTLEPYTMPPETASIADEDIISDCDEDNSKDKINSSKCDNRTPKYVNNGKILCNGDANLLCSKALDFTCALFVTFVTFTKIKNDF